ncbi:MAG: hypothetical protein A2939_05175 [Parcubacteria group bacterium RIFCSPLOWO2_01_FULL_48_18]|nr:MAG: hypothetical protein A2939_05175 [Parcubacteria group bacterium RIFCSPLOWO2_01_FULL_48_18]
MKIGKLEITSGPNIPWYVATVFFIALGGWKGLFIWVAINIFFIGLALVVHKPLRDAVFNKAGR